MGGVIYIDNYKLVLIEYNYYTQIDLSNILIVFIFIFSILILKL